MDRRRFLRAAGGLAVGSSLVPLASATPAQSADTEQLPDGVLKPVLDGAFSGLLDSDTEIQHALMGELASSILTLDNIEEIGNVNLNEIDNQGFRAWRANNRVTYLIPILEDHLDVSFPDGLATTIVRRGRGVRDWLPLIASAQSVCEAAEAYDGAESDQERDKTLRTFGIALLVLISEIILSQYGVPYRLSFAFTGSLSRHVLFRFRGFMGPKVYALLLSELHWLVRGEALEGFGFIIKQTASFAADVAMEGAGVVDDLGSAGSPELSDEEKEAMSAELSIESEGEPDGLSEKVNETIDKVEKEIDETLESFGIDLGLDEDCEDGVKSDCGRERA